MTIRAVALKESWRQPGQPSWGRRLRLIGAVSVLALALLVLWRPYSTYCYFNSQSLAPLGGITTAGAEDLLEVRGQFDWWKWWSNGGDKTGISFINRSPYELWVMFSVTGDLADQVQHINPVPLLPGQEYQLPLRGPGWITPIFKSGTVTARVLNNYASYSCTIGPIFPLLSPAELKKIEKALNGKLAPPTESPQSPGKELLESSIDPDTRPGQDPQGPADGGPSGPEPAPPDDSGDVHPAPPPSPPSPASPSPGEQQTGDIPGGPEAIPDNAGS